MKISASGMLNVLTSVCPTAIQNLGPMQDTPFRYVNAVGVPAGVVTVVHVVGTTNCGLWTWVAKAPAGTVGNASAAIERNASPTRAFRIGKPRCTCCSHFRSAIPGVRPYCLDRADCEQGREADFKRRRPAECQC